MVVANVLAQEAFCVPLVHNDHVVEALPPEGPDHSFAIRVGLRCSRRCGETPRAEALHPAPEPGAVKRVAIVDEEARCLVVAVAHCFEPREPEKIPAISWSVPTFCGVQVPPISPTGVAIPRTRPTARGLSLNRRGCCGAGGVCARAAAGKKPSVSRATPITPPIRFIHLGRNLCAAHVRLPREIWATVPWASPGSRCHRTDDGSRSKRHLPSPDHHRARPHGLNFSPEIFHLPTYLAPGAWLTVGTRIKGDPSPVAYSTERRAPALPSRVHLRLFGWHHSWPQFFNRRHTSPPVFATQVSGAGYSTGIVTTMGAVAGYSNGTDTQDEFVVLDAWLHPAGELGSGLGKPHTLIVYCPTAQVVRSHVVADAPQVLDVT
jgi:hypothetical protein